MDKVVFLNFSQGVFLNFSQGRAVILRLLLCSSDVCVCVCVCVCEGGREGGKEGPLIIHNILSCWLQAFSIDLVDFFRDSKGYPLGRRSWTQFPLREEPRLEGSGVIDIGFALLTEFNLIHVKSAFVEMAIGWWLVHARKYDILTGPLVESIKNIPFGIYLLQLFKLRLVLLLEIAYLEFRHETLIL